MIHGCQPGRSAITAAANRASPTADTRFEGASVHSTPYTGSSSIGVGDHRDETSNW